MPSAILMLVAVVASGALFVKCTVLSSNQVRSMRWRTKLRMRPGPGFASHWEISFRFSRLAALYHGGRCRPDMPLWERLVSPARLYAVRLGRAPFMAKECDTTREPGRRRASWGIRRTFRVGRR